MTHIDKISDSCIRYCAINTQILMSVSHCIHSIDLDNIPFNRYGAICDTASGSTTVRIRSGMDIGRQFAEQNVGIRYVVTDGDACSAEGVTGGMADTSSEVERQVDTTHLEQSLFRNKHHDSEVQPPHISWINSSA